MDVVDFVLVDKTGQIAEAELVRVAAALRRQLREHFGRPRPFGWGTSANVRALRKGHPLRPNDVQVQLLAEADMPGAFGYHDVDERGMPTIKVFPSISAQYGEHWSVTVSHELLEVLADTELVWCAQDPRGIFWATEVADAVQGETYEIDGVLVSNFQTPYYFAPPANPQHAVGKMDHLGTVKRPFEVRPGGYSQYWHPSKGWVSIYGKKVPEGKKELGRLGRRSARALLHPLPRGPLGRIAVALAGGGPKIPDHDADGGIPGVPLEAFARMPALPDPLATPASDEPDPTPGGNAA